MESQQAYNHGREGALEFVRLFQAGYDEPRPDLLNAIAREMHDARIAEAKAQTGAVKYNFRGYLDQLAREYVKAQDQKTRGGK